MRHARQDKEEWRGNMELGSGGYASGWWGVAEKQASGNMGCEGTYRVLSEVVRRERIRVMLTGSKEAAD